MKFSEHYIVSHDIDWFCYINKTPIHVASAGGKLPKKINDREKLRRVQKDVFELPEIYSTDELKFNDKRLHEMFGDDIEKRDKYLESFAHFARRGICSFDRCLDDATKAESYFWVCMPPKLIETDIITLKYVNKKISIQSLLKGRARLVNILNKSIGRYC